MSWKAQRNNRPALPPEAPAETTKSPRLRRTGLALGMMLGLLLAACSGSSPSTNGVATLDSPSPGPSSGASADASLSPADAYQTMLAYSQCMRTHGVTNFPDPVNQGGRVGLSVQGGKGTGLDPNSATFQAAQQACQSLMPAPKTKTDTSGQNTQQAQEQALKFSECMRSHGVTDFPDPKVSSGGGISIQGGSGSDLNPNSPTFQAAQQACQSLMPGFGGGGTVTSDGAPTSNSQP